MANEKLTVRMKESRRPYNKGDLATFLEPVARRLIQQGAAVLHDPEAKPTREPGEKPRLKRRQPAAAA